MRKLFFTTAFFVLILFGFLFSMIISLATYHASTTALATNKAKPLYAALPTTENVFSTEITASDARTEQIRQFFATYNSPLEPYADEVVKDADEYGLDYRLVPAIAMQESNLCKRIPAGSYNCWGFGIYGKKITRFDNYADAINQVTKTLATKYKGQGLVTPDQIMTMYTPSSNGSWAFGVNQFMEQLQ